MKKLLLFSLILVLVLGAFSGCGDTTQTNEPDNTAVTSSSNTAQPSTATSGYKAPDPNKVYNIKWQPIHSMEVKADAPVKLELDKKFNVKFEVVATPTGNYEEVMNLKFASNDVPDVFWCSGGTSPTFTKWINQDLLAEVPWGMIKQFGPSIYKELNDNLKYDEKLLYYTVNNGKNYGLTSIWADGAYPAPVVWRDDWLKNVGITKIPETLEEFETALYKFTKNDPDKNGKDDTVGLSLSGLSSIYGTSGYWNTYWSNKSGNLVYGAVQPEMKNVLTLFAKWYKDGVLDPEYITGENQGGYFALSHKFFNGRIGLSSHGSYYHWSPPYYEGAIPSVNYDNFKKVQGQSATYAFGKPAVGANGKTGMGIPGLPSTYVVFGKHMEKEPDKMAKVLQVFNTFVEDENAYLLARYGVKGVHWDYDSKNFPTPKEAYVPADPQRALGAHLTFLTYHSVTQLKKINAAQYKWADANFNYAKYANEVFALLPAFSKYKADLDKLQDQVFTNIITGKEKPEAFDAFATKWKQSGGDEMSKEANDWFKKYKSEQVK